METSPSIPHHLAEKNKRVSQEKWYADGLKFTCTQCGNCCTGSAGYVWTSNEERQKIAEFLGIDIAEFKKKYARRIGLKYSLKERGKKDNWDCIFLVQKNGGRTCSIYPVRPRQCRTWPFWTENLSSPDAWDHSAKGCPGMNHGRHHDFVHIEVQRLGKI